MLGVCLGAQKIAHHLGGDVRSLESNVSEFGYYAITPTETGSAFLDNPLHVAQSHDHYFEIPDGAVRLATSALCPNQAFRYGDRVYGLQFHTEVSKDGFRLWQDLYGNLIQSEITGGAGLR
jgi:GMP synthase (glutamine-hydrolysing)